MYICVHRGERDRALCPEGARRICIRNNYYIYIYIYIYIVTLFIMLYNYYTFTITISFFLFKNKETLLVCLINTMTVLR